MTNDLFSSMNLNTEKFDQFQEMALDASFDQTVKNFEFSQENKALSSASNAANATIAGVGTPR